MPPIARVHRVFSGTTVQNVVNYEVCRTNSGLHARIHTEKSGTGYAAPDQNVAAMLQKYDRC